LIPKGALSRLRYQIRRRQK